MNVKREKRNRFRMRFLPGGQSRRPRPSAGRAGAQAAPEPAQTPGPITATWGSHLGKRAALNLHFFAWKGKKHHKIGTTGSGSKQKC